MAVRLREQVAATRLKPKCGSRRIMFIGGGRQRVCQMKLTGPLAMYLVNKLSNTMLYVL